MKRIIATLLCLILLIGTFSACKIESPAGRESRLAQSNLADTTQGEATQSETEHATVPAQHPSTQPAPNAEQSKPSRPNSATPDDTGSGSGAATTSPAKPTPGTPNNPNPPGTPPTINGPQQPTRPIEKQISVQVEISCKKAVGNPSLKAGIILPIDGTLLRTVTIQIASKESAFLATQKACKQANLYFGSSGSAYGKYVSMLGPLGEKDCGSGSGWLYFVNDKSPSKSADQYELTDGDKIRWEFTLS